MTPAAPSPGESTSPKRDTTPHPRPDAEREGGADSVVLPAPQPKSDWSQYDRCSQSYRRGRVVAPFWRFELARARRDD